jgi:hypothetical protein
MTRSERREQQRRWDNHYGIPNSQKIETKNTFGCEVSNDYIPKNQMDLLRKFGLRNIIKVKRRKNGITGSMKPNDCHRNVRKLVERCGGKQLLGYMIEKESENPFQITYHSVWITPKGEVIDPTSSRDKVRDERETTYFSPLYIYKDDGFWIEGKNLMFPNDYVKNGYFICDREFDDEGMTHIMGDVIYTLTDLSWRMVFYSNRYLTKEDRVSNSLRHLHDGTGGFTEPSRYERTNKNNNTKSYKGKK